ncbi:XkdW family protein [Paenibacillus chondroitinus]|uniref:XkdW family protein n=1 Tax=Paenibacillus chondroitinus TaxID=59842 RepID=A0ABU6DIY3_9BACL|nr:MULTISPECIES: XkdW family protein [Paenibacillus]MCY9660301.1 XkdW family protein [Paenibacillus anseongense]MEB4797727.1 XkdW family protein [Paenibacillus chondroitinus]
MDMVKSIFHLFPGAQPGADFRIAVDTSEENMKPYISFWNLEAAQPTEEELQAAWKAMQPTPESQIANAKLSKTAELNTACNAAILAGFTSNVLGANHTYDFDYEAQTNLNTMLNAIIAGLVSEPIIWKASNKLQPHTIDQFKTLFTDSLTHKTTSINKYWELKMTVESANSMEGVASISW